MNSKTHIILLGGGMYWMILFLKEVSLYVFLLVGRGNSLREQKIAEAKAYLTYYSTGIQERLVEELSSYLSFFLSPKPNKPKLPTLTISAHNIKNQWKIYIYTQTQQVPQKYNNKTPKIENLPKKKKQLKI